LVKDIPNRRLDEDSEVTREAFRIGSSQ